MIVRRGGGWIAALGIFALGLGCGGSPDEASEAAGPVVNVEPIDTPQGGRTAWTRRLGGVGPELAVAVAAAPDGGTVLVTSIGDPGTGETPASVGVVRLRPDGSVWWSREFRTPGAVIFRPSAAVRGMGNVFLLLHATCDTAGATCPDFGGGQAEGTILVKLSPAGAFVWQRSAEDVRHFSNVAVDATGSAAFAGVPMTASGVSPRIYKYRWDGVRLWDLPVPPVDGSIDPIPGSLAFDPQGNLVIGVRLTLASLDANGAVRWKRDIARNEVLGGWTTLGVTARGTVVAVVQHGMGTLTWAGTQSTQMRYKGTALFLAVAEADGTPRFGRALAGDFRSPVGASVDPAGRVAILMRRPEPCTERLERWNLAGERLWARELACGTTGDTWWAASRSIPSRTTSASPAGCGARWTSARGP